MVLCFTVIVIGFELVFFHWVVACHMCHSATIYKKPKMIVYAQSGMEFHREEKDESEILHLGQFHI